MCVDIPVHNIAQLEVQRSASPLSFSLHDWVEAVAPVRTFVEIPTRALVCFCVSSSIAPACRALDSVSPQKSGRDRAYILLCKYIRNPINKAGRVPLVSQRRQVRPAVRRFSAFKRAGLNCLQQGAWHTL